MKRLQASIAIVGLAACGTGIANANILVNADLDNIAVGPQVNASPQQWNVVASTTFGGSFADGGDSEPWCNVQQPAGYGFFFKPFQGSISSGVGNLLNCFLFQDNPGSPGAQYSLSGYAAGEANFCAYFPTNTPAPQARFVIEFLNNANVVIASNSLDLVTAGMPNGGPGSMAQFTTPQFTAPAGTATVRAGAFLGSAYSTTGAQSFFVDAFDLEVVYPPGSPVITNQPAATTAPLGGSASMTVGVSNPTGCTYQWQMEGTNVVNGVNGISGGTTATLSITGASVNNVGHYKVIVSNSNGTVVSSLAPLALDTFNFYPVVAIYGVIGATYQVSSSPTVSGTYTPFATVKLTTSPQYVIDASSPGTNTKFYQATFLY